MRCTRCDADLKCITMTGDWQDRPGGSRELVISLECPHCGQLHRSKPHHIYSNCFHPIDPPPDG